MFNDNQIRLSPFDWFKHLTVITAVLGLLTVAFIETPVVDWSRALAGRTTGVATSTKEAAAGYGIAASFEHLSPAQLDLQMAAIQATGSTWVRYDLSWNAVQPHRGASYNWTGADRVTASAHRHGLKVILAVGLTPADQRVAGCRSGERCAPADPAAYAAFMDAAVRHYSPLGVKHWEIWNEPNIAYRFGPATNPAAYTAMLKASYIAIKRVDPQATVIGASTAPAASRNGDLTPYDFLKAMYDQGAHGYFDAISSHPYTYPITPSQSTPADAWGQLTRMHELMREHGDGDKKIWITEFGTPTNGPNLPGEYVSEAAQAQIVTEAIELFGQMPWSGPFLWYEFQDSGTSAATSENFYGLIRADGSRKPAYDAFVTAIR
jgi:polysaccharide biosynthesis protein PslG